MPADPADDETTLVLAQWTFAETGRSRGEEGLAAAFPPDDTEGRFTA